MGHYPKAIDKALKQFLSNFNVQHIDLGFKIDPKAVIQLYSLPESIITKITKPFPVLTWIPAFAGMTLCCERHFHTELKTIHPNARHSGMLLAGIQMFWEINFEGIPVLRTPIYEYRGNPNCSTELHTCILIPLHLQSVIKPCRNDWLFKFS